MYWDSSKSCVKSGDMSFSVALWVEYEYFSLYITKWWLVYGCICFSRLSTIFAFTRYTATLFGIMIGLAFNMHGRSNGGAMVMLVLGGL